MNLVRSISLKNPSNSTESISFAPPCFSTPSTPLSRHYFWNSQPGVCLDPPTKQDSPTAATYKCMSSILTKDGQVLSIAVLNGTTAYTGSESNVIRIWKLPEFTECGQLKSTAKMVVAIQVSNDRVFAAYVDSKIRIWSRSTYGGVTKHVRLVTIPKTGGYVRSYISGKDKMMKHMAPISSLDISLSDDIIYSASLDKTVKAWRISDLKCMETIQAHSAPINAVVIAENGVLYTASDDATVKVWRRNFGSNNSCPHALTVTLPAKSSPVKTLALNSEAGVLYGGCTDGYIHYWLKGWFSGQLQYGGILQGHTHAVLCLSSFSNFVVSGSADSTVRIWIRQQDEEHICVAVLQGDRGPIRSLAAFPCRVVEDSDQDGCIVCTGSMDGVLKLWQVSCCSNPGLSRIGSDYFELNK
ncbi:WD repeat-containing protein tag-125-like protein [Heracleum sosnowskyi]|uniref:WD repeat-containing protein tag-125-like protein n=1 Tax=Heracleum sosnowskyi TaxID=360622 RepID=A0AAD8M3U6_9APIA|nr:WD repeat-containing protein tag-125-like protein [Heracleum sosnowskyi]